MGGTSEAVIVKKASKSYACEWCYERIGKSEPYTKYFDFENAIGVHMHPECHAASMKADLDDALPPPGTYRRGCWCGERAEHCQCEKERDTNG